MATYTLILASIILIAIASFGGCIATHAVTEKNFIIPALPHYREFIQNFIEQVMSAGEQPSKRVISIYTDLCTIRDKMQLVEKFISQFVILYTVTFPAIMATTYIITAALLKVEMGALKLALICVTAGLNAILIIMAISIAFYLSKVIKDLKTFGQTMLNTYKDAISTDEDVGALRKRAMYSSIYDMLVDISSFYANECRSIKSFATMLWGSLLFLSMIIFIVFLIPG